MWKQLLATRGEKGGKAKQRQPKKKKAALVSELDSVQHTLILWFLGVYSNPPNFSGSHAEITPAYAATPPQQNWS